METDGRVSGGEQQGRTAGPAHRSRISTSWVALAAVVGPVAVAVALVPWRAHLDGADDALVLVVVIVAVASSGRRAAAVVAALVAALAFDFFLTRPYQSFRIEREQDLVTEVLLLVVGLTVGELAARGRRHRRTASERGDELAVLHAVTELSASGHTPREVISAAGLELRDLLFLDDCLFVGSLADPVVTRITTQGVVQVGAAPWPTERIGLPTRTVDLPVRGGGWLLGHFLLTPSPGRPVSRERLQVAVAIADQVGASLAAERSSPTGPG